MNASSRPEAMPWLARPLVAYWPERAPAVTTSRTAIGARAAFDFIRYASVWEDADVLCEALAPVARGGRLCSVASAGDNVLALLTLDPAEVVAVDLSRAQLACVELRLAAFRRLAHEEVVAFLGVSASATRPRTYAGLRADLSPGARAFWDAHPAEIACGAIHAGKFERYFGLFRRWLLPLVHSRRTIDALCRAKPIGAQREFYAHRWDTWRWRALFRMFFGRAVMGRLGRDPEFFATVEGPVADRILERSRWALTELPVATNPFLTYIMTGNFSPAALPRYLRPAHAAEIRGRLDRVRLIEGAVEQAVDGCFDGFNLSDVFEYMSLEQHLRCYDAILGHARAGARLVYWNMLAPRARPESEAHRARPLEDLARALHARDRAWFYQRLMVDEVA
jgi:S-adenosylmethionine:diacylglycerol 3-amino-3-carboxypropyl transferase